MSKEEIITAVAVTTDKRLLSRLSDVINHKDVQLEKKQESDSRLITQVEAAKRLSLSTTTVWRLLNEGLIETVTVHRRRRVRLASLIAYSQGERS